MERRNERETAGKKGKKLGVRMREVVEQWTQRDIDTETRRDTEIRERAKNRMRADAAFNRYGMHEATAQS